MNADAPLRRLVENPVALDGYKPRPGAPHPHHPMLTDDHTIEVKPRPAVRFPQTEEGIRRLLQLTDGAVPALDAELHPQAWRALLGRPTMRLPMRDPDENERLSLDIVENLDLPATRFARIVIGAVICEVALGYGSTEGLSCEPVCGIVDITVLRNEDGSSVQAWARATWHTSSIDTLDTLERFAPQLLAPELRAVTASPDNPAGRRNRAKSKKSLRPRTAATKRVVVVLPDYPIPGEPTDWNATLATIGNLIGLDVVAARVNPHNQTDLDSIVRMLSSTPPALLLIAGVPPELTTRLVDAYVAASTGPRVEHLEPGREAPAILREVRAVLLRIAGIASGLMPVGVTPRQARRDSAAPTITTLPDFPIQEQGRIGRYGRAVLVEDRRSGVWYSRDDTRHGADTTEDHGDAQYKMFRQDNGDLILQASADQQGEAIVDKHESRRRGTISMKDIDWNKT